MRPSSILLIACLLTSCADAPGGRVGDTAAGPRTVRVGIVPGFSALPFYIAQEKGFFEQTGVRLELVERAADSLVVEALTGGKIDVAASLPVADVVVLEATSSGLVGIIGSSFVDHEHPSDVILVPRKTEIRGLEDLAGKRIGVEPGIAADLFRRFLHEKNVASDRVVFVPLPHEQQLRALTDKTIDVLHAYEPVTTAGLLRADVRKFYGSVYADILDVVPHDAAVMTAELALRDPEAARRVMTLFERAFAYIAAQPDSAREVLRRRVKLDEEVAKRVVIPTMLLGRRLDSAPLQRFADVMLQMKRITHRVDMEGMVVGRPQR